MKNDILLELIKKGNLPKNIEEVIKVLEPYFDNADVLRKYAFDSQILSSYEFLVKYKRDEEFEEGIKLVTDYYKRVYKSYKQEMWHIILSTYELMVEDENKMCSIREKRIDFDDNDAYEEMLQIFNKIGDVLEVSVKHIVRELYALIYLYNNGNVDYNTIMRQSFGVVVNNILDKGLFHSILRIESYDMKISDWRNIAYHHTYSLGGK